jgi:hypothetical protein
MVDGSLDFSLVLLVQGTSRLIKEEDLWLLDKSSSNGDPLLLTTRKLATGVSHIGVDTFSAQFLIDKVPGIC